MSGQHKFRDGSTTALSVSPKQGAASGWLAEPPGGWHSGTPVSQTGQERNCFAVTSPPGLPFARHPKGFLSTIL